LPRDLDLSAYRIVQEALTNTVKHARASAADVCISYGERELGIEVTDDGPGPATPAVGSGHGLVGMRERVALYEGQLTVGPGTGCGFTVRALLPLGGTA
jgi:signal transduction histidine kinase